MHLNSYLINMYTKDGIDKKKSLNYLLERISLKYGPEYIGHYIDHFLVPIVQNQCTYIKDTTDFINKINSLKTTYKLLVGQF